MPRLQHTLNSAYTKIYSQKNDTVKEHFKKKLKNMLKKEKEPLGLPKQKPTKTITNITDDFVNTYIEENPDTVTNYLRNERVM